MIDGASASVSDFGAIGDGVVDDTVAIQTAFDWLGNGPFRHLSFASNSTYKVSTTLTMTSTWTTRQCTVSGNRAQVVFYGASGALFDFSSVGNSVFRDLYLISNTSGVGTAIYSRPAAGQYSGQCLFENIQILDFERGLQWGSATSGANGGWSTNFIDLDISSCDIGVYLTEGGNNALNFVGCRVASCGQGVVIDGSCYEVKFIGGAYEFHTTAAFVFGGTSEKFSISMDGLYMENASTDFQFNAGTTNLRNLSVKDCYIFSSSATKVAVSSVGSGFSGSNICFRDNFIYTSAGSFYGDLPVGTTLSNNYAPFEQAAGGIGLKYENSTKQYFLSAQSAGVKSDVTTNQPCNEVGSYRWTLFHNNNDGDYVFSGNLVVSQGDDPKFTTDIALKSASGGGAASGTIGFVNDTNIIKFEYTPLAGVTTLSTSYLVLTRT